MPSSAPTPSKNALPTHFAALFNCASLDSFRRSLSAHLKQYHINDAHPDTETTLLAHLAKNAQTPLHLDFIRAALARGAAPEFIDMTGKKALEHLSFSPAFGLQTEERLAAFKTDLVNEYNEAHHAEFTAKTLIQPARLNEFESTWENQILAHYGSDVPQFEKLSADVQFKGLVLKLKNYFFVSPESFVNLGLFLGGVTNLVGALEQAVQAKIADPLIEFDRAEKINACNQRFGAIKSILTSVIKAYETQASLERGKEIASRDTKQEAALRREAEAQALAAVMLASEHKRQAVHTQEALSQARSLFENTVSLLSAERKKVTDAKEINSSLEQALEEKQIALSAEEEKSREAQAQVERLNAQLAEQEEKTRQAQTQLGIVQATTSGPNAHGVLGQTASMVIGLVGGVAWTLGLSGTAQPSLSATVSGPSSLTNLLSDPVVSSLATEVWYGGRYFTLQNTHTVSVPETVHLLKEALSQTDPEERGRQLNLVFQRAQRKHAAQPEEPTAYKVWLEQVVLRLGKLFPANEVVTRRSTGPQLG